MRKSQISSPPSGRTKRQGGLVAWSGLLLTLLLVIFLCGFSYSGYLLYNWARSVVAAAPELPSLPLPRLGLPSEQIQEQPQVMVSPQAQPRIFELLTPWEKKERLNILLLGTDQRPDDYSSRTDTIIVLTLDPETGDAGMLSIPRDLWVPIPGYYEDRINQAYVLGEINNYPGGGPALAMRTVEEFLGYPVHHYALINFEGFMGIIDIVGCVDIDVTEDIDDPEFPDENYGISPLFIPAGQHCMDGELALKYARTRRQGADYARARRQQQVLLALKDKLLEQNVLTQLLPKVPQLAAKLADAVQTDLPLDQIVSLARLADDLDLGSIQQLVIDNTLTTPDVTEGGAWVLLPEREEIRPLVDAMFAPPPPVSEEEIEQQKEQLLEQQRQQELQQTQDVQDLVEEAVDPVDPEQASMESLLQSEAATIVLYNGTSQIGLEVRTTEWLEQQGFLVVSFGTADRSDYPETVLVDYSDKEVTVQALAELFHLSPDNRRPGNNLKSPVDIRLILGADWRIP